VKVKEAPKVKEKLNIPEKIEKSFQSNDERKAIAGLLRARKV